MSQRSISGGGVGRHCGDPIAVPGKFEAGEAIVYGQLHGVIAPDNWAEVTVVAPWLLRQLKERWIWLSSQVLAQSAAVADISDKPVSVRNKFKLDLKFSTPGGPLRFQNVVCWVTVGPLPRGLGDLLLSRSVMERLGYSLERLLGDTHQIQSVYNMSDLDDTAASGVQSVPAYHGNAVRPQSTENENALHEDEDRACFPTNSLTALADEEEALMTLMGKIEEASHLEHYKSGWDSSAHS
jgi:hypothetical protein